MRLNARIVVGLALAIVALAGIGVAIAAVVAPDGRIGPSMRLLGNGRHLTPQGRMTRVGNFPTGGALSTDGRFYWTVSTGRGFNDIRIVSVRTGRIVQIVPLPGASGGIAMDPTQPVAYVSGVADSEHKDQQRPGAPGRQGDVLHVFHYTKAGTATETGTIPVPPPSDSPDPQNFPPTDTVGKKVSWPDRLAVSRDGRTLLVPLNLADRAAIVDVPSKGVRYVTTGSYPYGAAILRDGRTGLVSNESPGTVSVIDLQAGTKTKDIQVGSHLSHPEAIALDPRADRAYVAIANTDQVAVIDTKQLAVERTLSVGRPEGNGTSPVALTVTPDGSQLVVAEAGADELAVFQLPSAAGARSSALQRRAAAVLTHEARAAAARAPSASGDPDDAPRATAAATPRPADYSLVGRIPVASYPADVQVAPASANPCTARRKRTHHRLPRRRAGIAAKRKAATPRTPMCAKLLWVAGKGLGVGPNPNGPNPYVINDDNALAQSYLPSIVNGVAGALDYPSTDRVRALTPAASTQLRPSNAEAAPPGTPLRPGGPIKHVFYIVKENRTYDQILGDESRGDGDPNLALFGRQVTPNHHALAERFGLLDHVYANSEASIDGHFWASAAKVSDYVHKNWNQNYGARNRPYDFGVYSVTWPGNGFIFDQLERQSISWFNFGEAVAGVVGLFPDKDRTTEETQQVNAKFAKSDLGTPYPAQCFPNDAFIFKDGINQNTTSDASPPAGFPANTESRADCFKQKFTLQVAQNNVPAFTYITLPMDHTEGATPGQPTPRAYVANNDYGLAQVVDTISHSSIWKESAIFVIEDDSQDGADHVDAHRIPAFVISPYAKRGAVVHTRYDFLSVIRSMELIIGMKPLGLFDQLATPMYDAFTSNPDNGEPYSAISPTWPLNERNANTRANQRLAGGLNFRDTDRVPQVVLDRQLWKSVYGPNSEPPPPGPNAAPGQ
jgi:DNA-binding beta-propeller fold protein YncE/phospholipase C